MKNCSSCGSSMAEKDRFCGICGRPAPDPADPQLGPVQTDKAATPGKQSHMAIWAFALALAVAMLGGLGFYFAPWASNHSPDEPATPDKTGSTASNQPALEATLQSERSRLAAETAKPEQAASEGPPASSPPVADTAIQPGRWRFTNELVKVSRPDPSDTRFVWEEKDIGNTSSNERCISEGAARAPRQASFPMLPERKCRARSFAMSGGRYRARFQCEFKGDPNGSDVTVDGIYTNQDLHVMALVTRAADLGSDDPSYHPPQIVVHFRIDGEYLRPCR